MLIDEVAEKGRRCPNEVDRQIGLRIRLRRRELRMSQEALAGAVGLTFQQLQKYEKGSNRVSASRLVEIANLLGVPCSYLLEGLPSSTTAGNIDDAISFLATRDGARLVGAFRNMKDPRIRSAVLQLVTTLAGDQV